MIPKFRTIIDLQARVPGCFHFTWDELLYHEKWDCHVYPTEEQYRNLVIITRSLDLIRIHFGSPIYIHSGLRSRVYNDHVIGGAKRSYHIVGKALDFHVDGYSCDEVKKEVIPMLTHLDIRMEDNGDGADWIHVDSGDVLSDKRRFFRP